MIKAYPKEFIEKIREEILSGKPKYRVARELGIADNTVYIHRIDIPSRECKRVLSRDLILQIREEVLKGKAVKS